MYRLYSLLLVKSFVASKGCHSDVFFIAGILAESNRVTLADFCPLSNLFFSEVWVTFLELSKELLNNLVLSVVFCST